MTVALYARRKQWTVDSIEIRMRHSKVHAVDCGECETREGKLDQIQTEIHITGALTDEQKAQLFAIALKCPVHRTLKSEIHIETRLFG